MDNWQGVLLMFAQPHEILTGPPPLADWSQSNPVTVMRGSADAPAHSAMQRVRPVQFVPYMGGHALLYQCGPHNGTTQAGAFAFTKDFYSYQDMFNAPSMWERTESWQGERALPTCLVRDVQSNQWVAYVCGTTGGGAAGAIRCAGIFRSPDLSPGSWVAKPGGAVITLDTADIRSWAPQGADSVYVNACIYKDGIYHLLVQVGQNGTPKYRMGIITSYSPEGPWVGGSHNPVLSSLAWSPEGIIFHHPTYHNGKYYSVATSVGDVPGDRREIGIVESTDLITWADVYGVPAINVNGIDVDGGLLVPFETHWAILTGERSATGNLLLFSSGISASLVSGLSDGRGVQPIVASSEISTNQSYNVTVAAGAFIDVVNIGRCEILGGVVIGPKVALVVTVDGKKVLDTRNSSVRGDLSGSTGQASALMIPPIKSYGSVRVQMFNIDATSAKFGYQIFYRV